MGECDRVECRAVNLLVVHGVQDNFAVVLLLLDKVAVNPRGSSHVKAFLAFDKVIRMDSLERGVALVLIMSPCRTMRFVTDDKANFLHPELMLRLAHNLNRLVG